MTDGIFHALAAILTLLVVALAGERLAHLPHDHRVYSHNGSATYAE
jgi:hypothetical protein